MARSPPDSAAATARGPYQYSSPLRRVSGPTTRRVSRQWRPVAGWVGAACEHESGAGCAKPEVVAKNPKLGGRVAATPAIADNALYVRTGKHLYAFAAQKRGKRRRFLQLR
jgi:hypothetical protein